MRAFGSFICGMLVGGALVWGAVPLPHKVSSEACIRDVGAEEGKSYKSNDQLSRCKEELKGSTQLLADCKTAREKHAQEVSECKEENSELIVRANQYSSDNQKTQGLVLLLAALALIYIATVMRSNSAHVVEDDPCVTSRSAPDQRDLDLERLARAWVVIKFALPFVTLLPMEFLPLSAPLYLKHHVPNLAISLGVGMIFTGLASFYIIHPIVKFSLKALLGKQFVGCEESVGVVTQSTTISIAAFVWLELLPLLSPDASDIAIITHLKNGVRTCLQETRSSMPWLTMTPLEAHYAWPEIPIAPQGADYVDVICMKSITYLLPAACSFSSLILFQSRLDAMNGWHVTLFLAVPLACATCLDWVCNPLIVHGLSLTTIVGLLCTCRGCSSLLGLACQHMALQRLLEWSLASLQAAQHRSILLPSKLFVQIFGELFIFGFDVIVGRVMGLHLMLLRSPTAETDMSSQPWLEWIIAIAVLSCATWFLMLIAGNLLNFSAIALNRHKISIDIHDLDLGQQTVRFKMHNAGSWPLVFARGTRVSFSGFLGRKPLWDELSITLIEGVTARAGGSVVVEGKAGWTAAGRSHLKHVLGCFSDVISGTLAPHVTGEVSVPLILAGWARISIHIPDFKFSCPDWLRKASDRLLPGHRQVIASSSQVLSQLQSDNQLERFQGGMAVAQTVTELLASIAAERESTWSSSFRRGLCLMHEATSANQTSNSDLDDDYVGFGALD